MLVTPRPTPGAPGIRQLLDFTCRPMDLFDLLLHVVRVARSYSSSRLFWTFPAALSTVILNSRFSRLSKSSNVSRPLCKVFYIKQLYQHLLGNNSECYQCNSIANSFLLHNRVMIFERIDEALAYSIT